MKTLILSSSLSPQSRSFVLAQAVHTQMLEKGVDVSLSDARTVELVPKHQDVPETMQGLITQIADADNIIFAMGVHNYSVNDSLKMILDNLPSESMEGKFFGILCAGGGEKSYLSTTHLTQMCMNEWGMMQLPQVVYATGADMEGDAIVSDEVKEYIDTFVEAFVSVGHKLLA